MQVVSPLPDGAPDPVGWRDTPIRLGLLTVAAVVAGALLETVGVGHTLRSARYAALPAAKVQAAFVVGLWAACPTVWSVGGTTLRSITAYARGPVLTPRRQHGLAVAVVLLVSSTAAVAGAYARGTNTGPYLGLWRTVGSYAVATLAAFPALLTMWRAWRVARDLRVRPPGDVDEMVKVLTLVRWAIVTAVAAAGAVVSIGVLAAGAQRQAWLAFGGDPSAYPPDFVVVTGLLLTIFLGVNFVPAWMQWRLSASCELERRLPPLLPPQPGWQERTADRGTYSTMLQLPESLRDVASSAVVVLGPLVSAGLSLFLPTSR